MSTSSNTPTTSTIFDETSGDLALISSDDTIFHVPRAVLQLSSKVFETMFKAGTESTEDAAPIRMQATAKELEMVLKFAHPGHKNPVVNDAVTLVDLLRVVKQYEMDVILDNLREWLVKPRYENSVSIEPIAVREPLVSLVAAVSFEFKDETRFALREIVKCDLEKELDKARKYDIPLSLMHSLYKLRAERVAWYMEKVMELSEASIVTFQQPAIAQNDVFFAQPIVQNGYFFGQPSPAPPAVRSVVKDTTVVDLGGCLRWQYAAMKRLEERPSFHTLKLLVYEETSGTTGKGVFSRSDIRSKVRTLMEKWELEASILESGFPELNPVPVGEV